MTTVSRMPRPDTQAIPSTNGTKPDLAALAALITQALTEHPELASLVQPPAAPKRRSGSHAPKLRCTRCAQTFAPTDVYTIIVRHREDGKRVSDGGCFCCLNCWPVLNKQLHLRSFGSGFHGNVDDMRSAWALIREQRDANGAR